MTPKPFLIINSEESTLASGYKIDGENLAIVMARNYKEAIDIFIENNPAWKIEDILVRTVPVY